MSTRKKVLVAMDPGFDGCKLCINDLLLNIPFSAVDITEKDSQFIANRTLEDFIRSEINGRKYLLGQRAKDSLLESSNRAEAKQMDTYYTLGRFKTYEYKVAIKSFLAYALYKYEKHCKENNIKDGFTIDELNNGNVELCVGVALPHSQKDEIWQESVLPALLEPMQLKIMIGESAPVEFDFKLDEENLCMNSQVFSAMFSVTMNENGEYKPEAIDNKMLPMLVVDAGYLTVGIFLFSPTGEVVYAKSNQEFAMHNVNERVAGIMREYRPDVTAYNVETMAKKNEFLRYSFKENGETKYSFYNVKELQDTEIERAAVNLNSHFCNTFNDLLDVKTVIVAGGTGEQYYKHLEPEYTKRLINANLATPEINGEAQKSVYAVVLGLYRSMKQIF